ncbi:hypothetical protein NIA73_10650 [Anaerobutyricum hallii]|nr:hypothetical protein [Anaerobutyricum hallii]
MEKRKDAAGYQHQCFTMMVLLNVIIVLFLTFTIVLTQYRVAAAQEAQKFIGTLKVMPERPEQRIIMVVFSLFFFMWDYLLQEKKMRPRAKRRFYCGMCSRLSFLFLY